MRDQQPKTPVSPALTRASAHHTGASGIAIPAPIQLLLAAAATEGTGAAAIEARAATPPPIQRTDILQGQPAATAPAPEIKPFRLQVNDNPPPSPQVQPWPMVQRQDKRPVVQMAPKRKRGAEGNGGPPDRAPKGRQKSEIEEKEKEYDRPRRELRRSPRLQKGKKQEGPPRKRQRRHERTDMEDTHRYSPAVDMLSEDGEGLAAQEDRPPQPAGLLGIVTWNVAHFSNKKETKETTGGKGKEKEDSVSGHRAVGAQLKDIQEYVRTSSANWQRFSKEAAKFIARLADKAEDDELGQRQQDEETRQKIQTARQELTALLLEHDEATGEMSRFVEHDWEADALDAEFNIMDRGTQVRNIKAFRSFVNHYVLNLELILGALGDLERPQPEKKALGSSLKEMLKKLDSFLHSMNIAFHVSEMFANNKWLDIVVLQEVNDPSLLENKDAPYHMNTGPHMISGGSQPQNEFYPILIRKESGFHVNRTFPIGTNGRENTVQQPEDDQTGNAAGEIHWNKKNKDYRPIIVYELVRQASGSDKAETVWVGVVHTTPIRTPNVIAEYNRQKIFKEVELALKVLYAKASQAGIPLIIGGDYYLAREALVAQQNKETRRLDPRSDQKRAKDDRAANKEVEESTHEQWDPLNKEMLDGSYPKLIKDWKRVMKLWRQRYKKNKPGGPPPGDPRPEMQAIFRNWEVNSLVEFDQMVKQQRALFEEKHKHLKILNESRRRAQILRNVRRQTTRHMIKAMKLKASYPISGTNPKANPLESWRNLQMADLFVGYGWQTHRAGILRPEGGVVRTDTEDLRHSRYWQPFSDHFPVAGIFSTAPQTDEAASAKLSEAFVQQNMAEEAAMEFNINSFAYKYLRKQLLAAGKHGRTARNIEEYKEDDRLNMAWKFLNGRLQKLKAKYPNTPMPEEEEEELGNKKESEDKPVAWEDLQLLIEKIEGMEQHLISTKEINKKKRLGAIKAGAIEPESIDPKRAGGQDGAGPAPLPVYKGTYGMAGWGPQTEHHAQDMQEEEEDTDVEEEEEP